MIRTAPPLDGISYSFAGRGETDVVRTLLAANDLPHEDIDDHIDHFLLARDRHKVIATAAVELVGHCGLLRSVCVRPEYRKRGLATALCDRIEAYARNAGVGRLYLLTTTAREFFEHRGYRVCVREIVPSEVRATAEFDRLCPSTTVCMVKEIEGGVV